MGALKACPRDPKAAGASVSGSDGELPTILAAANQ